MVTSYDDKDAIATAVRHGAHRDLIGGLWEEIGSLQLEFLKSNGLKKGSRLLDIGCGSLRLGVRAVDFLDSGHYWGTDLNESLLDAGYEKEIVPAGLTDKLPRENLVTDGDFGFPGIPQEVNFAIAQSLFTHLPLNHLRVCLTNLAEHVTGDCTFFATFFIVPEAELAQSFRHEPGAITSYPHRDPYHYCLADIFHAAFQTPWEVAYLGDWSHPRAQKMVAFRIGGPATAAKLAFSKAFKRFCLCTVVDHHPRFHVELVLWTICASRYLPQELFHLVVYFVGDPPRDLADWLAERDVEVRTMEPIIPDSPHCNKIGPFLEAHRSEFTAVTDTDLFFVADPSPLFNSRRFRAAPNNAANPPAHIFKKLLEAAGLKRGYRPTLAVFKGGSMRETHLNNISAGLIVAPAERRVEFAEIWRKWAHWLVQNRTLMESWAVHVDQVAFALAMEELGEDVEFLPPQVNIVLHILGEIATAYAFHISSAHVPEFASRFNPDRTLSPVGLEPGLSATIQRLNQCIDEAAEVIGILPSTRVHFDKFLNPDWRR